MSISLLIVILFWGMFGLGKSLVVKAQSVPSVSQLPPVEEFLDSFPERLPVIPSSVEVKGFRFVGNTAFSQEELNIVVQDLTGESVTFAELLEARSRITQHYINQGYITSGAYLPAKQVINNGFVTIEVIEGKLTQINISGLEHLTPSYLRRRISRAVDTPLNINDLVMVLEKLRRNPLLENLSAELTASSQQGESILNLEAKSANPFTFSATLNNHNSPTIGVWEQEIELGHGNLFGWGDRFSVTYANSEGGEEWGVDYILPVNSQNGTLRLSYQDLNADIIEEPFNQVDIETASRQYEIAFRQPLIDRLTEELAFGVVFFHQNSKTRLLGVPFPLNVGADERGEIKLSGLRFFQEWTRQSSQDVILLRNQFNIGTSWLDATQNDVAPDSNFFSWQVDAQWLHSFGINHVLISRFRSQISDRALLAAEDLTIGGVNSVRGYRRDLYLVDRGILASIEYRFPVFEINRNQVVQSVSFFDLGWGENTGDDPNSDYLASVGVGLRWQIIDRLTAEVNWAFPLVEVIDRNEERFLFSISINPN